MLWIPDDYCWITRINLQEYNNIKHIIVIKKLTVLYVYKIVNFIDCIFMHFVADDDDNDDDDDNSN